MALTEPGKIITPWANTGLKNAIPDAANPVSGSAGYDLGFPAVTMTPPEAGGIPPQGQDFNGILYEITAALRYMQAGGVPTFSASLSSAIGGYSKGAIVLGSDGVTIYRSLINSNTSDPNTGGANWAKNDSDKFPALFSANGYQKLSSGLIIQWGSVTVSTGGSFTFPIAFPTALLGFSVIHGSGATGVVSASVGVANNAGLQILHNGTSNIFRIIAIGN